MSWWKWTVAVGCAYEIAALHERSPLPTISRLLNLCSNHRTLRAVAWVWAGAWAWHFLVAPQTTDN